MGIPPESVNRVFDRFYRVGEARTRTDGGSGHRLDRQAGCGVSRRIGFGGYSAWEGHHVYRSAAASRPGP
ncbi:MAG: hypothetical protein JO108_30285 [Acidobacteriaceae bacterium]|nr:hypothetical protein [Acidobacteriaceae bacterium]